MPPKLQDFLFEHFRDTYKFQLERIDKLRDRITFVVAFLSILGSALLFLLTNYSHAWRGGWCCFFYVPAAIAALLFIASASLLLWVIGGRFDYEFIPDNPEVQEFAQQIADWTATTGGTPDDALNATKEAMLARYRDGAHRNFGVNRRRTDRLLFAQRIAVLAFLFAFAAAPRYYFDKSKEDAKPTKVLLVSDNKPKSNAMPDPDTTKPAAPAPTTEAKPAAQPAAAPAKPVLAPNKVMSEGSLRMETKSAPAPKKDD